MHETTKPVESLRLPGVTSPIARLRLALAVFCLSVLGCDAAEPSPKSPSKEETPIAQKDNPGLALHLRRLPGDGSDKNIVTFVEEVENASDRPVCFAMRTIHRRIVQVASSHLVEGERKLQYHSEPIVVDCLGMDPDSLKQLVKDFPTGSGACDGGEILAPGATTTDLPESFTILCEGLYQMQTEWTVDILDAQEGPRYKVLGKCTLKSNVLDVDIAKDVEQGADKGQNDEKKPSAEESETSGNTKSPEV